VPPDPTDPAARFPHRPDHSPRPSVTLAPEYSGASVTDGRAEDVASQSSPSNTGHDEPMFRRHPVLSLATLAYLAFVGFVTLGPQPLDRGGQHLLWRVLRVFAGHDLTSWITYSRVEFLANVGMFVPIGVFFLLLFGRRFWFVGIIAGVVLTSAIEFSQLFIAGRVSDPRDIVANSLGATIGVLVALLVTTPAALRDRRERRELDRRNPVLSR
jgi:VanZ family protein